MFVVLLLGLVAGSSLHGAASLASARSTRSASRSAGAAVARTRDALEVALPTAPAERFRIEDDPDRKLIASVYSFPSTLVEPSAGIALLSAVRALDAHRQLLVLADPPMATALAAAARRLDTRVLATRGGPYTPWPRDPFSFARARDGAVRVVVRPNLQPGREVDAAMGAELVADLPPDLDRAWGGVRWARAPVPFHNGQVLLTRTAAWVSVHTFEPRALALLGIARVPVASFGTSAGIARYVGAVERAAAELGALYGRSVRFVHPLPAASADDATAAALMRRIGGGAGIDLDSVVTLLPPGAASPAGTALVADLSLGERLLRGAPAAERTTLAARYALHGGPELATVLDATAEGERARGLASFLDLVADHLRAQGLAVARTPLLVVPAALQLAGPLQSGQDFLVTMNNVVVERREDGLRAEGFASGLAGFDDAARATFASHGVHLDLLPTLAASVVRNGGYRCASNHLRAGETGPREAVPRRGAG